MSVELLGLSKYCETVRSGMLSFKYAPYKWFSSIPDLIQEDGTVSGSFQFDLNNWLDAVVFPKSNKMSLLIRKRRSSYGNLREIIYSGFIPEDNKHVQNELVRMEQERFILLSEDVNKRFRILGSKEQPLDFSFNYKNGDGRIGYTIEFKGIMSFNPPIYNI